ncbi:MAG: aldo/keto reductase [Candidatus Methylomirabilia bacterium]
MMTSPETAPRHTNRLINETSPYLLQHAHNPVDWYPWGEAALRRAKEEDRPILLSIGYSACHWCHVMERESFEDEGIAALMNQHFVSIKVDREERPDLDEIYMAATLALNAGQGGWPMTVFLTPDQTPFFAGTYFPPTDRYGRPGFATLLMRIAECWQKNRAGLEAQAGQVREHLREQLHRVVPLAVGAAELDAAATQFARDFDLAHGGFGPAPKFPPATGLSLLLRHYRRSRDVNARRMVQKTLDAMAQGGIYDQIGGGFARYSTDERWLVPHFEKMLYDNALLAKVYLEASQVTSEALYRRVATEILDYVLREMTAPEGGFYSATDADSEGEEGKFFVWSPGEIEAILGEEEGPRFCAYYDITDEGNWEGKSIPNTPRTLQRVAATLGTSPEALQRSLDGARPRVYEARQRRVHPNLDDKILTAWNGMMIGAMAEGYRVLGEGRYLEAAERAANFLLTTMVRPDGGLLRTYRAGRAHLDAYLEDYAFLCEALIDLYESGGAARYLCEAERLADRLLADFANDEGGGFHNTARGHEALLVRHRDGADGATPSGNAVAASALARLSFHLDRADLREAAGKATMAYGRAIARYPRAFAKSLAVVDFLLEGPVELAVVGRPGEAGFEALRRAIAGHYLPNRIIAHHDPTAGDPSFPLLAGKGLVSGKAAVYVCRNFACQAPITDPREVAGALAADSQDLVADKRTLIGPLRSGSATPAGTASYASRFVGAAAAGAYAPLGSTGLIVGRVGFGGYRVDDETPEHRDALEKALVSGSNLIDTSTNYTDGGSERLVGAVLNELVRRGRLHREELIVVSKIGYVQGSNLILAQEREAAGRPFPEMVKYMEGCWHCLHPEFLRDQLDRSLARLGLETLDVCLLHNPEYFLSDAKRRGAGPLAALRDEFYRRMTEAFRFFEAQVALGTIRWYGVSSNTAPVATADPEATSLTRMLGAAREAGGADHHFRVLQLPINLFEAGGVLEPNNGPKGDQTVLELASREGIGVLVNRPLNASVGDGLLRLADVQVGTAEVPLDVQLVEFRRQAAQKSQARSRAVAAAIDPLLPSERRGETLSRKALWVLASTPGVSAVLNGMRTPAYVDDALGILRWPPLASVLPIYQAIRGLELPRPYGDRAPQNPKSKVVSWGA